MPLGDALCGPRGGFRNPAVCVPNLAQIFLSGVTFDLSRQELVEPPGGGTGGGDGGAGGGGGNRPPGGGGSSLKNVHSKASPTLLQSLHISPPVYLLTCRRSCPGAWRSCPGAWKPVAESGPLPSFCRTALQAPGGGGGGVRGGGTRICFALSLFHALRMLKMRTVPWPSAFM